MFKHKLRHLVQHSWLPWGQGILPSFFCLGAAESWCPWCPSTSQDCLVQLTICVIRARCLNRSGGSLAVGHNPPASILSIQKGYWIFALIRLWNCAAECLADFCAFCWFYFDKKCFEEKHLKDSSHIRVKLFALCFCKISSESKPFIPLLPFHKDGN